MGKKSDLTVEIDHWRLKLNSLAADPTKLTEAEILAVSQILDELIVEFYKVSA
ncbi:aspartyl-phosphate phosphatase Spo0E family protein [Paenibacillus tarimensis]